MIKGQLKILGIIINKGCSSCIKKNLEENLIYPLYREFKDFDKTNYLLNSAQSLPLDFYSDPTLSPHISISAIVGPNGGGKSGLIDIVLRLINNAACKLVKQYNYTNNLVFVKGLRASLYYSIGDTLFCLTQDGDKLQQIKLYRIINGIKESVAFKKKNFGKFFFYSVLLNYSIHAFNSYDYKEEWDNSFNYEGDDGCWIKGASHKNDGYLAPLVLNPKRTEGNIDINIENHLAKSRLLSLSFLENGLPNTSYTYINNRYSISSIELSLDLESVNEKYQNLFAWWKKQKSDYDDREERFLRDCIINLWRQRYKFREINDNDLVGKTALNYIVYKTLSIATKYDVFDNGYALSPNHQYNDFSAQSAWAFEIDKLITEINQDRSHITFRLRQTLAFLIYRHYNVTTAERVNIDIEQFSQLPKQYKISADWDVTELVPPPCFSTDIIIKDNQTNEKFSFTRLSSGERQLSYVSSTILYHLKNLNSVPENIRRAKYRHINVILDEIELYFHPEYQKNFVQHLIDCLNSVKIKDIISINVIMITHSPFILSDIPKSNVLFLNNGRPNYEMQENTFASNIHSILQNGFFLENGTIGNFAKKKVNEMFRQLHNGQISPNLREQILLVSEPVIRTQLLKMYNELSTNFIETEKEIGFLLEEIQKLKNEINRLKK